MSDAIEVGQYDVWGYMPPEAGQRTTDLARRTLQATISLLSSTTPGDEIIQSTSVTEQRMQLPPHSGDLCRRVADSGRPLVIFDISTDVSFATLPESAAIVPEGVVAYIGVPVRLSSGQTIGTLCVMDLEARDWGDNDVALVTELAASLASQIELKLEVARRERREKPGNPGIARPSDAATCPPNLDELRTPLQTVIGFSDLLRVEKQPDRIVAHAKSIQSAAKAMLSIINRSIVQANGGERNCRIAAVSTADGADETIERTDDTGMQTRVLLADDLDLNRKLIADMLGTDGHVVDCVSDGAEAVKAAAEHHYDVILMDMIMPGMDGITATQEIRKLPAPACDVPILALTAHSFKDQLESCLTAGMNATLTKPMSLEALTSAVSSWTRKREAA